MSIEVFNGGDKWREVDPRLEREFTCVVPGGGEVESQAVFKFNLEFVKDKFSKLLMGEIRGFRLGLIGRDYLLEVDFKNVSIFGFISKNLLKGTISGGSSFHSVALSGEPQRVVPGKKLLNCSPSFD